MTMNTSAVVLINAFDVPAGEENVFEQGWDRVHDFLMTQDGYRSSQLNRSIGLNANFRYVNVAVWDSEEAFKAATSQPEFQGAEFPYRYRASLYEVVRADEHWEAPSRETSQAA
jgi:heme oxygenase (mycobilin-producing)